MIIGNTLTDIYEKTLKEFKKIKQIQSSQFGDTLEILNYSCCLKNPRARFIFTKNRKHSLKYLIGELIWYFSGERSIERISRYSKFWGHIADEKNEVNSNYGYKIFSKKINRKSQYQYVLEELKRDSLSRRAIMMLNLIDEDYYQMHETKDFPCTILIQFMIRNNKLHMFVTMRSNDFVYGFCNDVVFFTILQELFAIRLGIELGYYYHSSNSEHIYEKHFPLLEFKSAKEKQKEVFPKISKFDLIYIDKLVEYEKYIREKKELPITTHELRCYPEFSRFIINQLYKIWK